MSPKEKAIDLFNTFHYDKILYHELAIPHSRQCALIAANEAKKCTKYEKQTFENDRFSEDYWTLVEQEINKLYIISWHKLNQ